MDKQEIWKLYKRCGNIDYEVSNYGRLRSVTYMKLQERGGYLNAVINGTRESVHRVVGKVFLDWNPFKKEAVVHHKDHNKFNNHVDNLEWTTQSNNIRSSLRIRGKNTWDDELAREIKKLDVKGYKRREIAVELSIDPDLVTRVKRSKYYKTQDMI